MTRLYYTHCTALCSAVQYTYILYTAMRHTQIKNGAQCMNHRKHTHTHALTCHMKVGRTKNLTMKNVECENEIESLNSA